MAKVFLSFEAESDEELARLVLSYAAQHRRAPSWLGQPSSPSDPELVADQATLTDEDYDAKHSNAAPAAPKPEPEPEPEPEPAKPARKPRAGPRGGCVCAGVRARTRSGSGPRCADERASGARNA